MHKVCRSTDLMRYELSYCTTRPEGTWGNERGGIRWRERSITEGMKNGGNAGPERTQRARQEK
ncbi:hypothetical protein B0H17DRAFT_1061845 [Mycena rosella]|uniref:Uncharacterized protein n=1 Tax=Mycena rosella TaxID=1033263 RepID=A0AAD7DL61_MYCRO|nr:hypothetical protein B0H17DRAFT_1061845 [Mycena rosella]